MELAMLAGAGFSWEHPSLAQASAGPPVGRGPEGN